MKSVLFFTLLINGVSLAQKNDKDLWSLVAAEKSFSKMSEDKNLRDAFVFFFAPNAADIDQGAEVNGLEKAKKMKVDSTYITWQPNFADISASKDFGYTTGPVKFYKGRNDTALLGAIYYSTMWEKQADGKWKVIFDLGSAKAEADPPALAFSKNPLTVTAGTVSAKTALDDVIGLDKEYVGKLNAKNGTVEPFYFSDEGRVHRPRTYPVKGKTAIEAYADPKERTYIYKQLNGRIARSGDLAFTFGTVDITVNINTNPQKIPGRYFRIWKKESGGWKIVLDVLG